MDELAVVGLDLETEREVSLLGQSDVPRWRRKGQVGDRSLVCLHCYDGTDGPPRRVPLVVKGRVAGQRRAHFAHPAGTGPPGGVHRAESVWHAAGKQVLAAWARTQPEVSSARVEAWTSDGRRRSDVRIHLQPSDEADQRGGEVALELQSQWITDDEWLRRHDDYQLLGITDVWLWHTRVGVPGIVPAHHQPGWVYGEDRTQLGALIGLGHPRTLGWWSAPDPTIYGRYWPADGDESTRLLPIPLNRTQLTVDGLAPQPEILATWANATRRAARDASHQARKGRPPRRQHARQPSRCPPSGPGDPSGRHPWPASTRAG